MKTVYVPGHDVEVYQLSELKEVNRRKYDEIIAKYAEFESSEDYWRDCAQEHIETVFACYGVTINKGRTNNPDAIKPLKWQWELDNGNFSFEGTFVSSDVHDPVDITLDKDEQEMLNQLKIWSAKYPKMEGTFSGRTTVRVELFADNFDEEVEFSDKDAYHIEHLLEGLGGIALKMLRDNYESVTSEASLCEGADAMERWYTITGEIFDE
jgi:hypothetical protein